MRIAPHRGEMLHASCASSSRRRERGFSIIEILIVMAIIAVLALAAAPWFAKISQRNEVKSAGSELAITLAAARMRAVKRNLPARVVITRATGSQGFHLVETFEEVIPTPIKVAGGAHLRPGRLPAVRRLPDRMGRRNPTRRHLRAGRPRAQAAAVTSRSAARVGAGTQNDLPVEVSANGKIEVLKPNPTNTTAGRRGTEWH